MRGARLAGARHSFGSSVGRPPRHSISNDRQPPLLRQENVACVEERSAKLAFRQTFRVQIGEEAPPYHRIATGYWADTHHRV